VISEILLHDSRIFATRFQGAFPAIHEKAGKEKILLIPQLLYNQYPFRIFRHPETVIATLSYQPYNLACRANHILIFLSGKEKTYDLSDNR